MTTARCIRSKPKINQTALLSAFKERNLDEFENLVEGPYINIDHFYGDPDNGTLLDLSCRSTCYSEYIEILKSKNASGWLQNKITYKYPIQEAIENSDTDTLQILVQSWPWPIHQSDEYDNNVLHAAIKRNDIELVRALLKRRNLWQKSPDVTNTRQNPSALHLALQKGNVEISKILIECAESYIDLDFQKDSQGLTCRQIIHRQYPRLVELLRTRSISCTEQILFSMLKRGETDLFINLANQVSAEVLNDGYLGESFLHFACMKNYPDVVDMLLERKVYPNKAAKCGTDSDQETPIMVAARKGHHDIVCKLLKNPKVELQFEGVGSILHSVVNGALQSQNNKNDIQKCFDLLLDISSSEADRLDINFADSTNSTPLHLAVQNDIEWAIKSLLRAGAHLYLKNSEGKTPLSSIKLSILGSYMDSCIYLPENACRMCFDYKIFIQPSKNHSPANEMEFLGIIQGVPQLRKLLDHPLSKSFLHMKWNLVKKYYFLNVFFYLIFCSVLSSYYIFQTRHCPSSSINFNSSSTINTSDDLIPCDSRWLRSSIVLLHFLLILRELGYFLVFQKKYFRSMENWLMVIVILMVGIFFHLDGILVQRTSLEVGIISALWIGSMFLLGRHPRLSIYAEIFKKLVSNFIKFIVLYLSQIMKSLNLRVSLIKSIAIITGESKASSKQIDLDFNHTNVCFGFFVFFVNLMLDAELDALASHVEYLSRLELLAMVNPFQFCLSFEWSSRYHAYIEAFERVCLSIYHKMYRDKIKLLRGVLPTLKEMNSKTMQ